MAMSWDENGNFSSKSFEGVGSTEVKKLPGIPWCGVEEGTPGRLPSPKGDSPEEGSDDPPEEKE